MDPVLHCCNTCETMISMHNYDGKATGIFRLFEYTCFLKISCFAGSLCCLPS